MKAIIGILAIIGFCYGAVEWPYYGPQCRLPKTYYPYTIGFQLNHRLENCTFIRCWLYVRRYELQRTNLGLAREECENSLNMEIIHFPKYRGDDKIIRGQVLFAPTVDWYRFIGEMRCGGAVTCSFDHVRNPPPPTLVSAKLVHNNKETKEASVIIRVYHEPDVRVHELFVRCRFRNTDLRVKNCNTNYVQYYNLYPINNQKTNTNFVIYNHSYVDGAVAVYEVALADGYYNGEIYSHSAKSEFTTEVAVPVAFKTGTGFIHSITATAFYNRYNIAVNWTWPTLAETFRFELYTEKYRKVYIENILYHDALLPGETDKFYYEMKRDRYLPLGNYILFAGGLTDSRLPVPGNGQRYFSVEMVAPESVKETVTKMNCTSFLSVSWTVPKRSVQDLFVISLCHNPDICALQYSMSMTDPELNMSIMDMPENEQTENWEPRRHFEYEFEPLYLLQGSYTIKIYSLYGSVNSSTTETTFNI